MCETSPAQPDFTKEELDAIHRAAMLAAGDLRTPIEEAAVLLRVAEKIIPESET